MANKASSFFQKHKSRIQLGGILSAFIAASALFVAMLSIQAKVLGGYEKAELYVARRELPKGLILTPENASSYLELREIDASFVPPSALTDPSQIASLSAAYDIDAGTILTSGMFVPAERGLAELLQPVLVGIRAEDLYQAVGGTLRGGDCIRVYGENEEHGGVELLWPELYIADAFDTTGARIAPEDRSGSAVRFNVYLEQSDVERFYGGLTSKSLRIVKVCE